MARLRDGTTTEDPRLDRLVEMDVASRDHPITARLPTATPARDKIWRLDRAKMGDQGQEGACVEFGLLHVLACLPISVPLAALRRVRAEHLIYWAAQGYRFPWLPPEWTGDPWPGGSYPGADPAYDGTSELTGIKVARALGFIDTFRWSFKFDDAVAGVMYTSPANLAINWTRGLSTPRYDGLVVDDGDVRGGHDIAWIGVQWGRRFPSDGRTGPRRDVAVLAQSWGLDHGDGGRIYVPLDHLERRLADDGTCAFLLNEQRVDTLPA